MCMYVSMYDYHYLNVYIFVLINNINTMYYDNCVFIFLTSFSEFTIFSENVMYSHINIIQIYYSR